MESFYLSVSTVPSFEDDFTHNMWNPLLELLFHEQVSGVSRSLSLVILLLILISYKEGAYESA